MGTSEQLSSDMNKFGPVQEQENILRILSANSELHLRGIHQELVNMDASAFSHSPEPGNTWNDERHILRALDEIRDTATAILNRIRQYQDREPDKNDDRIAKRIAIEFDIVAQASVYIENESGLVQEVPSRSLAQEEAASLLEEVRKYDRSILKKLKKFGVLNDPNAPDRERAHYID